MADEGADAVKKHVEDTVAEGLRGFVGDKPPTKRSVEYMTITFTVKPSRSWWQRLKDWWHD